MPDDSAYDDDETSVANGMGVVKMKYFFLWWRYAAGRFVHGTRALAEKKLSDSE